MFDIAGTDEIADTSLNFSSGAGWTGAVTALAELDSGTLATIRQSYVEDLLDGLANISWADYSRLLALKVAAVGTDGLYLTDARISEATTPSAGTAVGILPQDTVVLTTRSGFTIGGGNYGRMYLPHTSIGTVTGSPYANSTNTAAVAADGASFVGVVRDAINGDVTATMIPAIMSQVGSGTVKEIASVQVGNLTDTQRRRRNRLPETYATAAVP